MLTTLDSCPAQTEQMEKLAELLNKILVYCIKLEDLHQQEEPKNHYFQNQLSLTSARSGTAGLLQSVKKILATVKTSGQVIGIISTGLLSIVGSLENLKEKPEIAAPAD